MYFPDICKYSLENCLSKSQVTLIKIQVVLAWGGFRLHSHLYLGQWLLTGDDFAPRRIFINVRTQFWLLKLGEIYWQLVDRGQEHH